MRKYRTCFCSVITALCLLTFFSSWAKDRRQELKEKFAPSENIRQLRNARFISQEKQDVAFRAGGRNAPDFVPNDYSLIGEYAVYSSQYQTEIEEDIAFIRGRVRMEVFRKGMVRIPLTESSVGLKEVSLNRKPCFIIKERDQYFLIINKPGVYDLDLEFFTRVIREREHGPGSVSFRVLPSPVSILDVEMSESGVEIFVEPAIKTETEKTAKKTMATVVLPYTERVTARWSKELPKEVIPKEEIDPRIYVDTSTLVSIGDGVARCVSNLNYSVLQREVSGLMVCFPSDVGIMEVKGRQIRDWNVKTVEGRQILNVYLNYGVKGKYELNVVYEKNIGSGSVIAQIPAMTVLNTERQRGYVGIEARTNIELAFEQINGAAVVDVKELPQQVWTQARNPVLLAFKYLKAPYKVSLDVKKHQEIPVLVAAVDYAGYVSLITDEGKILTKAVYQTRNNVKQFMRISLPEQAELWSCFVSNKPVKPAKDEQGNILIPLEKSRISNESLTQFPVEIVYLNKKPKLGLMGNLSLLLPKIDIPASEIFWSVYLPDKYNYLKFRGDLKSIGLSARGRIDKPAKKATGKGWGKSLSFQDSDNMYSSQVEMEEGVLAAAGDITASGVLPIKIDIPERGVLYRFGKLLVTDESPWLKISYIFRPGSVVKKIVQIFFILVFVWLLFLMVKKLGACRSGNSEDNQKEQE